MPPAERQVYSHPGNVAARDRDFFERLPFMVIPIDMPSPRWPLFLALFLLLAGCDQRSLRQRTEEIRQISDKEDRAYASQAVLRIQHTYWTVHDGAWLGKLPDGSIVRLDSPHATAAPLPSRAFYSGWHLQLTISSEDWRTYPPASYDHPFEVVYAITRHNASNWNIEVSSGPETSPLRHEDALRLQAADPETDY